MAEIVLGIWTTHGPQLSTSPEQWSLRVPADRSRKHWFKGKLYPFEELVEMRRSENLDKRSALDARTRSHAACQKAIARVAEIWKEVRPDVCVVFGNDQDGHQITRASFFSLSTSFLAISVGVPSRNSVFLVFCGT